MDGLQAIRDRIMEEARGTAAQIIEQAELQAGSILAAAEAEKVKILAEAARKSENQADALLARARSTAVMESRKTLLKFRQDLIDRAIADAANQVRQLPDERKIAFYRSLIRNSTIREGELLLSAEDRHLAPKLLEGHGSLRLSDETGSFCGGLVIRRGLIEDNLTLAIIVANIRPELVRLAADILFAGDSQQGA